MGVSLLPYSVALFIFCTQLISGETIDPRVVEKHLNACPAIVHSAVVGNNFLRGPAQFVCIIIELAPGAQSERRSAHSEVTRAIASVNRTLAPPLRTPWSRVLILNEDQSIPYTKKGLIFRKKLESVYGEQLGQLLATGSRPGTGRNPPVTKINGIAASFSKEVVAEIVRDAVSRALHLSENVLEENSTSTFAEVRVSLVS